MQLDLNGKKPNLLAITLTIAIRYESVITVFWIVFDFYLLKKMYQRTCIKFFVKNEIKCADAFRMLTVAYGEATLDRSNVYRWYKMFSEGREDVNDERPMKGRRYATLDEIKTASKEELKNIFKNDFLKCFEDWRNRWHKCIISHGDYFEGD
ncbi:hypothetical protein LAZ67_20000663 [Cordylochernes scorpioides]|uniref:Mos1 transposase HTH domain-containing protein n=1 Tax=Cordylochernes scorpioides TaxID=51811 RepID=A0ABY6LJD9_9ARAC|nr:hypothetical protein LAZ67_20000663 [Cordylochernes scorpioides]